MSPEFTLPRLKHLNYLMRHNSMKTKQTKHQRPQLKNLGEMKQKMIYRLSTPLTHVTPVKNNNTPFAKVISCKNLT